jgi:hypothetical protein
VEGASAATASVVCRCRYSPAIPFPTLRGIIGADRAGNASSNGLGGVNPCLTPKDGDELDIIVNGLSSAFVIAESVGGISGEDISPINRKGWVVEVAVAAEDDGDVMDETLVLRLPLFG